MTSYDTAFEFEEEFDEFEGNGLGDDGFASEGVGDSPLSQEEEEEWAEELMGVSSDEELEEFLGKLIKKAGRAAGKFIKSPVGKALGGALKKVAKTALPAVGGAIGSFVAPGVGTALGTKLGSMATKLFEMEYEAETMDDDELEFEVARRVVRLSAAAAKNAANARSGANPQTVAKAAVVKAAKTNAPTLAKVIAKTPPNRLVRPTGAIATSGRGSAGRWVRRGNRIVIYGA